MAVGIVGIGSFVPDEALTNLDLEKMVDTSDEWITTRTGIKERRIVGRDAYTSDLAAEAGKKAMESAGIAAEEIDLVIVATSSPDMIFPSTACLSLEKLGIKNRPAFDVQAACTGFVYALSIAEQFVSNGMYSKCLVIGADAFTRYLNWSDRNTCVLFGDGAGAVVLGEVDEGYGILASYLVADGEGANLLKIPIGSASLSEVREDRKRKLPYLYMNGNEVFRFAVRAIPEAAEKALRESGLTISDVDFVIPHQANKRIIEAAAERLGVQSSKVISNIESFGNTSTASIPLVIDGLYREGKLRPGNILLLVGFGGGLTWGANVIRWSINRKIKVDKGEG